MRLILLICFLLSGCATPAPTCIRPVWPQQPRYPLLDLKPTADNATLIKSYVATVYGQQQFINNSLKPFFITQN